MTVNLADVFTHAAAAAADSAHAASGTRSEKHTVSLQELLRLHGEASTAVVLLLLSAASVLPVAGVGTILSLAIFSLAWRWAQQQETTTLPERVGNVTLNPVWTRRCLHGLAWTYRQADRWLKIRWSILTHERFRPGWALWIALMGFVIFLPLPLGNVLPALSLVSLSLGWMFRDGLAMVLSALFGIAALALLVGFSHLLLDMVQPLGVWLAHLF
jgi:hypothetical protein